MIPYTPYKYNILGLKVNKEKPKADEHNNIKNEKDHLDYQCPIALRPLRGHMQHLISRHKVVKLTSQEFKCFQVSSSFFLLSLFSWKAQIPNTPINGSSTEH